MPIRNSVALIVLQHPAEKDKPLGSAKLTCQLLSNAELKIGLSWRGLKNILGPKAGPDIVNRQWGVLYLGSAKLKPQLAALDRELICVDKKGKPLAEQDQVIKGLKGLVVLDGNWAQVKSMWWRNPWLLKLQRLVVNPKQRSMYGELRREPRRESVSTIEAVAIALSEIEGNQDLRAKLFEEFKGALARVDTATLRSTPP